MGQQPQKQVIPADKLVTTKYQRIGRCNNYAMLQNIPCSKECKIVGILLVDHALSLALNAIADFPAVYIQQFWNTVKLVPNVNDTIRFTIDRETITYIVDIFLKIVGYEGIVDKKFHSIAQRLEENYHSIKDDIPLVSVYTTGNVIMRGMLIPGEFLTDEIHATPEYKEYEKEFFKKPSTTPILPPSDDGERDEIAEATLLSLTMNKNGLAAEAQENVAKVQEKILEEDIEKIVEGEDENSYASAFADSVFKMTKILDDDNDDDKNDDNDDHDDHALEMSDTLNNLVPELSVAKTNELLKEAIPRMVNDAVK
ncbi:hypothetical protein Tco_0937773 [Tanacetum coccineum]|uniref:Uncharacterized protein n=1 Tax=Tanacetum coccineum TaxID=301880 RepID=A0ABQ5DH62_9ASTR